MKTTQYITALAVALLVTSPAAFAKNGSDDRSGRGGGHGADDIGQDDRGGGSHGSDDNNPGDDNGNRGGGHGADDLPGDDSPRNDNQSGNNGGGNNQQSSNFRIAVRLLPPTGVTTIATGKVDTRSKSKKNKSEQRFTAKVEIPVGSTVPPLASADDAPDLAIALTLSRGGVAYALCSFTFDHLDTNSLGVVKAEYKIDQRNKTKGSRVRSRSKKGVCDIDLATADIQAGIPAVQQGDTASASVATPGFTGEFLAGTF